MMELSHVTATPCGLCTISSGDAVTFDGYQLATNVEKGG